jgi:hypothetical protein
MKSFNFLKAKKKFKISNIVLGECKRNINFQKLDHITKEKKFNQCVLD